MKNLLKPSLLLAAATFTLFTACEKDSKPFAAGGSVQTFFSVARPDEEMFSFQAEEGGFFTTAQKSFIFVPPNAFITQTGQPVTGSVSLGFYEVKTKSDMIRFDLPTIADDKQVLESGGMVFFGASQAGQSLLRPNPGNRIEIWQATDKPSEEMRLFFEAYIAQDFGWIPFPGSSDNNVNLTSSPDSVNSPGYGFQYFIDSLYTWINCDRFLNLPANQLTNVSAKLSDVFTAENTAIYLVFNELNSVIRLWTVNEPSIFQGENFPLDAKVTFLAVAVSQDGAYFFDKKSMTISAALQVELSPKETSLEKILDSLEDLP